MDFGVYIHYPLCRRRCGYCDFATLHHAEFPHARYADRILEEAALRAVGYERWPLRSIYFGGGSPSLWPAEQVARVIEGLREMFGPAAVGVEVTLECNPQDVGKSELRGLRQAGVDRLSIGVQSWDDEMLRRLTRQHDGDRAMRCIKDARSVGFSNLSVDLIFGIQGQSVAHHLSQLQLALAHAPQHLSVYALTLSPGAPLREAGEREADADTGAEMLEVTVDTLEAAGYAHYEVSNFAREGRTSAHNEAVWRGKPYLGLGASAHSLLWQGQQNARVANRAFAGYMAAAPSATAPIPHLEGAAVEVLSVAESRYETLMLGMRTQRGVHDVDFEARFGEPMEAHFLAALRELEAAGLLRRVAEAWAPTRRGMLFADSVALRLASA